MKLFQFDMVINAAVGGVCKAPDLETAKEWIKDEYYSGDFNIELIDIQANEIPIEMDSKFPRIDITP